MYNEKNQEITYIKLSNQYKIIQLLASGYKIYKNFNNKCLIKK